MIYSIKFQWKLSASAIKKSKKSYSKPIQFLKLFESWLALPEHKYGI